MAASARCPEQVKEAMSHGGHLTRVSSVGASTCSNSVFPMSSIRRSPRTRRVVRRETCPRDRSEIQWEG